MTDEVANAMRAHGIPEQYANLVTGDDAETIKSKAALVAQLGGFQSPLIIPTEGQQPTIPDEVDPLTALLGNNHR